jgi:glycosyltransferase involved in cell wall biosynthesis
MQGHTRDRLRVGLDVSAAAGRRPRGIGGYIRGLLPALEATAPSIEPVLFLREERWLRRRVLSDLLPGARRRWMLEPVWVPTGDLDVFHGMGTRLPRSGKVPRSFTLHDLREFDLGELRSASAEAKGQSRKGRTIREADHILCISEYTRERLRCHFPGVAAEKAQVVYHGVDHERFFQQDPSRSEAVLTELGIRTPFLLQLGSFFPHKNLSLSIESFARSAARREGVGLVLVGGGGDTGALRRRCEELGIDGAVTWVEDLQGASVPLVLGAATALLFPSRYEGFGLPILEAMASGVPGVCSTCTCLPEVAGGIWRACDPGDVEGFGAALDELVFDGAERAARVEAGLIHARQFTWERCAAQTAEFLARAAAPA